MLKHIQEHFFSLRENFELIIIIDKNIFSKIKTKIYFKKSSKYK